MGRLNDIRNRLAELIDTSDEEIEPKGHAGEEQPTGTIVGNYLEHNPPREELNKYWELYRDVGIIKGAINNFASEVIEPGWYITADSEDTVDELTEYMENVAVVNLQRNANFSDLAWKLVVEREVRGTVFVEKVTNDEGRHQALYPLQNDTITIYTKPGKAMLPRPDDPVVEPFDQDIDLEQGGESRVPTTDAGETGAYVQFDDLKPRWNHKEEVVYTRNDVIHWPRDADIGEPRGVSRIRSIQDRAEGWLQKVQDNDAAIRSKAWPMIIFKMGSEDNPWTEQQVLDFLKDYDEENIEPGLMKAVSGDVSVEEFAGETADIEAPLQHDINAMMAGLPGPVYATGGFSRNVAPAVAQSQQRQFVKEVKETRRSLENNITPYLREVARDYDLDAADSVEFNMGRPPGDVAPEDVSGSIIRYTSDADPANQGSPGNQQNNANGAEGAAAPQPGQTSPAGQSNSSNQADNANFAGEQGFDEYDLETAELADPRFVSTTDSERRIASIISEVLLEARENVLREFERNYSDTPIVGSSQLDGISRRAMEATLQDPDVQTNTRPIVEDVISDTIDTLNQDNHSPKMNISMGARHRQRSRDIAQKIEDQIRKTAEEMLNDISTTIESAAQRGESIERIIDRVEESYSDSNIDNRADLIAHMELQSAVNNTKLFEYERSRDIDGIKVINTCGPNTTRLCEHLAGCDGHDQAVAWFDEEQTISEQLQEEVPDSLLFDGFDPLPMAPPFHFGCTSGIVPAQRDDE